MVRGVKGQKKNITFTNICLKLVICTTQMEHCFKMIVGQDLTINKMVK